MASYKQFTSFDVTTPSHVTTSLNNIKEDSYYKKKKYFSYLTINNELNEPNLDISDVMKRDTQNIIIQQNTMYIIGGIAASTFLILGIMFGYDD
jgi:hypothetical protein